MQTRVSGILLSKISRHLSQLRAASILENPSLFPLPLVPCEPKTHFSTIHNRPMSGDRRTDDPSEELFIRNLRFGEDGDEERTKKSNQDHPGTMPSRPLRREQRSMDPLRGEKGLVGETEDLFPELDDKHEKLNSTRQVPLRKIPNRPMRGEGREENGFLGQRFKSGDEGNEKDFEILNQKAPPRFASRPHGEERNDLSNKRGDQSVDRISTEEEDNQSGDTLFQKLKLGDVSNDKKVEEAHQNMSTLIHGNESAVCEPPSQDADEIFKKMKETGLIPNAVAMLDGLCKDGLVQEAMKLFGLMREKGTIPEVVIYTAVVGGFCKAAKFDDAKRIFRKMQKNGIVPNAFSYTVLVQGLCKGGKLEDSIEFFREMLNDGHSPNATIFTGLVDGLCRDKGLEEAESVVKSLRDRGFAVDEKAVREHLDKNGPFSPMVWEAIFGKKSSRRPF